MSQKITASITVNDVTTERRTYQKRINLPIDPVIGMKIATVCRSSKGEIIDGFTFDLAGILYFEETEELICFLHHSDHDNQRIDIACGNSNDWNLV